MERVTCMSCDKERHPSETTLRFVDVSKIYNMPAGTVKQCVRHCHDSRECREKAALYNVHYFKTQINERKKDASVKQTIPG